MQKIAHWADEFSRDDFGGNDFNNLYVNVDRQYPPPPKNDPPWANEPSTVVLGH